MNTVTRQRTRTEIECDLVAACSRLGELAMVSEINMQPLNCEAVARTADGLHALLIELRADLAGRAAG